MTPEEFLKVMAEMRREELEDKKRLNHRFNVVLFFALGFVCLLEVINVFFI